MQFEIVADNTGIRKGKSRRIEGKTNQKKNPDFQFVEYVRKTTESWFYAHFSRPISVNLSSMAKQTISFS